MDNHPFMETWSQSDPNESSAGIDDSSKRKRTFYEVLNVSTNATRSEVRESYIRLKNMFGAQNPALYSLIGDHESHRMLGTVEEAFRTLNDDFSRRRYDVEIGLVSESEVSYTSSFNGVHPSFGTQSKTSLSSGQGETSDANQPIRSTSFAKSLPPKKYLDADIVKCLDELVESATDLGDGALYRKLRETAAISEEELHSRTKIGRDYIKAIEENAYQDLPQSVFVKGFVKSYLKALSISQADTMVNAFAEGHKAWQIANNKS